MSGSNNNLEAMEELDNVPLVRMADIQPARILPDIVRVDTVVANDSDYDEEYVFKMDENDDSNAASLSVQSEEIVSTVESEEDDTEDGELIIPDEVPIDIPLPQTSETKANPPDSWPTLEILPGGVIKPAEKDEDVLNTSKQGQNASSNMEDSREMMYACAKCPQRFKDLFCLVKHVRWHEDEKKRAQGPDLSKLKAKPNKKFTSLHSNKRQIIKRRPKKL